MYFDPSVNIPKIPTDAMANSMSILIDEIKDT